MKSLKLVIVRSVPAVKDPSIIPNYGGVANVGCGQQERGNRSRTRGHGDGGFSDELAGECRTIAGDVGLPVISHEVLVTVNQQRAGSTVVSRPLSAIGVTCNRRVCHYASLIQRLPSTCSSPNRSHNFSVDSFIATT